MRSFSVSVLWVVAVVAVLASCETAPALPGLVVMTQDLAIGADLDAVLAASTADAPALVDAMWAEKDRSSFATRAEAIAADIALFQPDLVGVQSAVQWRRQAPASASPADELVSDYLELLLSALSARGVSYDPVVAVTTADVELTGASGDDYRLTDRLVILARDGVETSAASAGTFAALRTIATEGGALEYRRGWASVHAQKDGKGFRFVTAHLDSVDAATQREQATELRAVLAAEGAPTILAGNLASQVADPVFPAYSMIVSDSSWYSDPVALAGASFPTCCRDPALVDPGALLDRRVDVVLSTKQFLPFWGVRTRGNDAPMVSGLWPSAHAGVIASLKLE